MSELTNEWFSVAIMTESEMNENEYMDFNNLLKSKVNNLALICNIVRDETDQDYLEKIDARLDIKEKIKPIIIIFRADNDKVDKEIIKMKKKHKWKSLLNIIPEEEYELAYERALLNWDNIIYSCYDVDSAIEFLDSPQN